MAWLRDKESKFDDAQRRIERWGKEGPDPYLTEDDYPWDQEEFAVEHAVKPTHHTWWQHEIFGRVMDNHFIDFGPEHIAQYLLDLPPLNPEEKTKFRSSGPVMWRSLLHALFSYRLNNEWKTEDYNQIQELLREKRKELEEYCSVTLKNIHKGYTWGFDRRLWWPYDVLEILSGCQYLLDDFPSEMDWLLKNGKNSNFAKAQENVRATIQKTPSRPYELPSHHLWWSTPETKEKVDDAKNPMN